MLVGSEGGCVGAKLCCGAGYGCAAGMGIPGIPAAAYGIGCGIAASAASVGWGWGWGIVVVGAGACAIGLCAEMLVCFAMLANISMMFAGVLGGGAWAGGLRVSMPNAPGNPGGGLPGGVVESSAMERLDRFRSWTRFDPSRATHTLHHLQLLAELLNVTWWESLRSLPDIYQLLNPVLQGSANE
jgi:hypothetical protein